MRLSKLTNRKAVDFSEQSGRTFFGGEAVQWYEDRGGAPALGTHLVWGVVCAEFQERDHSVVQEQQDAGAHVHGPVVAGVKDQCVGTGAVRMGHKVLKTENPVQRRHGTDL